MVIITIANVGVEDVAKVYNVVTDGSHSQNMRVLSKLVSKVGYMIKEAIDSMT